MSIDDIRLRLGRDAPRLRAVSEATGVPLRTLEKIARGYTRDPRLETVRRLMALFAAEERRP